MPFFLQQGIVLSHMAAFEEHCAFGFWGAEMKKLLAKDRLASSKAMGSLGRITRLKDLPSDKSLLAYMRHAAELVESGQRNKSIERQPKGPRPEMRMPAELGAALKKNKLAATAFAAFSPSCRRDYAGVDCRGQAPRNQKEAHRTGGGVDRQGKSRNWKYEKRQDV
jgi:uncharacterized protein YdeI (YjbR/CyaY-like superfamily)